MIPENEIGLREVFASLAKTGELEIIESRTAFPDYLLRDMRDGIGRLIKAEAELVSSNFLSHKHDPAQCDLVVCWKHDANLPVEVFEVSNRSFYKPGILPLVADDDASTGNAPVLEIPLTPEMNAAFLEYWLTEAGLRAKLYEHKTCTNALAGKLGELLDMKDTTTIRQALLEWLSLYSAGKVDVAEYIGNVMGRLAYLG